MRGPLVRKLALALSELQSESNLLSRYHSFFANNF